MHDAAERREELLACTISNAQDKSPVSRTLVDIDPPTKDVASPVYGCYDRWVWLGGSGRRDCEPLTLLIVIRADDIHPLQRDHMFVYVCWPQSRLRPVQHFYTNAVPVGGARDLIGLSSKQGLARKRFQFSGQVARIDKQ